MLIKICGNKYRDNINEMLSVTPDILGFIFFPLSKRCVVDSLFPDDLNNIPQHIKRAGVFVNEKYEIIAQKTVDYKLHIVQLHGDESPEECKKLKEKGLDLIKAFRVDDSFDFSITEDYSQFCNYFLFDAGGQYYGGNGTKFDWSQIKQYSGKTPFLIGGGIGPESVSEIKRFSHPSFAGIDINSRFETGPGRKDYFLVRNFLKEIR